MSGMANWQAQIKIDIEDLKKRIKVAEGEIDKFANEDRKIKLDIDTKTLESAIQKLDKMLDSLGKGTGDFKQFENLSKELSNVVSEVHSLSKAFGKVDDSGTKTLLSSIQNIDRSLSELSQNILNVNKNMSNIGVNANGAVKQVENIGNSAAEAVRQVDKLADAQNKLGNKTNISSGMKNAIQADDASISVQKTTEAISEQNTALEENANRIKESVNELIKGRDIISQQWYKEKDTVVGKDLKGNDITRDVNQFSFIERLQNGQLQTVIATLDEKTGKWVEQVVNVRTAFEQVEKAIISADNKINSLENDRDKTLAAHPGYDISADEALINAEKKHRDELQQTLNLYATEKEYVYQIEAANKRIADNQERLKNVSAKKSNLRDTISDEQFNKDWDAAIAENNKRNAEAAKRLKKEFDDAWNEANKINSALNETGNIIKTLPEINELSAKFNDVKSKVNTLNSELVNGKISVSDYNKEIKSLTSSYISSVDNLKAEWDKNVQVIEDYMNAVTKLNKLKASDAGKGKKLNEIALQEENVTELEKAAYKARGALDSVVNPHNDKNIVSWKDWVSTMEQFAQASNGSAESVAKLKDALRNAETQAEKTQQTMLNSYSNRLESYNKKKDSYNATIARFEDGGWTSDDYLQKVNAVKNAIKEYETILNNLKTHPELVTDEGLNKLNEQEKLIKQNIAAVQNMSAAEKGYSLLSGQKAMDKINSILKENSAMSKEAKNQIRAWYNEIASGNPRKNLTQILGEVQKIVNAEADAGRAGKSMIDAIKEKAWYGVASAIGTYFGFNDVLRYGGEGINIVREFNTALTEMRKVSDETVQSLKNYQDITFDTADVIGTTAKQIQNSTADYMRLGESLDEASESAKTANILLNVSEFDNIEDATKSLVSMGQAYKDLDKLTIVDKLNEVGKIVAQTYSNVWCYKNIAW